MKNFTLLILFLLLYSSNNQINAQNGQVPTSMDVVFNPYQRPNIHQSYGKGKLEYYGSGDVNNDGKVDEMDIQAITAGVYNDMGDVNIDSQVNSEDVSLIQFFISGQVNLIGIDFWKDNTTKEERINAIFHSYQNIYIPTFETVVNRIGETIINPISGWVCSDYSTQAVIHMQGMNNLKNYFNQYCDWLTIKPDTIHNARFNLYCGEASVTTESGGAHSVLAFPIGDTLTKIDNWCLVDGECGVSANPGTRFNQFGKRTTIDWKGPLSYNGPTVSNGTVTNSMSLIEFMNYENKPDSVIFLHYFLPRINPARLNLYINPMESFEINFVQNINLSEIVTGLVSYETNLDTISVFKTCKYSCAGEENPYIQQGKNFILETERYSDAIPVHDGVEGLVEYDVKKWCIIKLAQRTTNIKSIFPLGNIDIVLKEDSICQILKIRDLESPNFNLPLDITINEGTELHPRNTGWISNVTDNSNLPCDTAFVYNEISSSSSAKEYEVIWTVTDFKGHSTVKKQIVTVALKTGIYESLENGNSITQLFPNPANNKICFNYSSNQRSGILIELIDLEGKVYYSEKKIVENKENSFEIIVSDFNKGLYLLRITNSDNKVDVKKIIKN